MIVCIPLRAPLADGERDAPVEPHLPHARYLHLYDTEARSGRTLDLRDMGGQNESFRIEALLCTSLDRMTLRQLMQRGIRVYGTDAETLQVAVGQFERGELVAVEGESESGCGGGGCGKSGGCGGHGHGHAHENEQAETSGGGCGCSGHAQSEAESAGGHGGCGSGGRCGCGGSAATDDEAALPTRGRARIAVCSQNRKTVTDHAGKCRKFWVYRIQGGQVAEKTLLELPIEQSFHETPADQAHPLDGVHALIAGSMGDGMKQRLIRNGIRGLVTDMQDPDEVVAVFLERALGIPRPVAA